MPSVITIDGALPAAGRPSFPAGRGDAKRVPLGAATDNPAALVERARRDAVIADARGDRLGFRTAAKLASLAASSAADVAAATIDLAAPQSARERSDVLAVLERGARRPAGALRRQFLNARHTLNTCFYDGGAACDRGKVMGAIDGVRRFVGEVDRALAEARHPRSRR